MSVWSFAGRAVLWNLCLGAVIGMATACAFAAPYIMSGDGFGMTAIVLLYGVMIGASLGACAGVVHGIAQAPLVLVGSGWVSRGVLRLQATAVSAVNVFLLFALLDFGLTAWAMVPFGGYVLASPFAAVAGYDPARTAAAPSAARRSGASSASRVSGSAPDSNAATSE